MEGAPRDIIAPQKAFVLRPVDVSRLVRVRNVAATAVAEAVGRAPEERSVRQRAYAAIRIAMSNALERYAVLTVVEVRADNAMSESCSVLRVNVFPMGNARHSVTVANAVRMAAAEAAESAQVARRAPTQGRVVCPSA